MFGADISADNVLCSEALDCIAIVAWLSVDSGEVVTSVVGDGTSMT